jgi:threonine synthase
VRAAEAIVLRHQPSGGLYVPETYPKVNVETGERGSYQATALRILQAYFPEAEESALKGMIGALTRVLTQIEVTPLVQLTGAESVLELWHGRHPNMAFKDVALQMLPHLMLESLRQTGEQKRVYILVATSGDTGKAALEGFKDVPGTRVLVFYPHGGVSEAQRLQMVTQEGGNMDVCAVRGNFDDAQTAVKQIFASKEIAAELEKLGWRLSSANSINFGRLLPQIVYYYTSYPDSSGARTIQRGVTRQLLRADRQLWRYPRGRVRAQDGTAGQQAHLRFQPQQRAHGLLYARCVRRQAPVLQEHELLDRYPHFLQPGAPAL